MPPVVSVGDQMDLVEASKFPYATFKFDKFNPVQSRVFDYYDKDNNLIVATATSSGKAQPNDALILTPLGYKKLGLISVGDKVIGFDGKPTEVIGIFPQGKKEIYKIFFEDGTSTECCEDHLWCVKTRKNRKISPFRILSLKDFSSKKLNYKNYHIPYINPVEFPHRDFVIDPYLLGLMLGDGSTAHASKITTAEESIKNSVDSLLPEGNTLEKTTNRPYDYLIKGDGLHSPLNREFDALGLLGRRAWEKFIPHIYLHCSIKQRWKLIRGLMDSDGGSQSGRRPTFEVSSKELAEGMAFLVRSLGGHTKIRFKEKTTYRYKGELRNGRPIYRLTISLNENPFLNSYKSRYSGMAIKRQRLRTIIKVEKCGIKECRCIKFDNQDGIYITNDFIVTHNTVVAEMMLSYEIREKKKKGLYLVPLKALAQEKIDDWTDGLHHFSDLKISICTGDYRLTADRKKELDEADLIVMSYEMYNSRVRNIDSERSEFLKKCGVLVADEFHLISSPGRGNHLEAGLMKFTEINKDCKLVFLSATLPNVNEIANWASFVLNNKHTVLLESKYRPCPLNLHFEKYWDGARTYEEREEQKVNLALEIVDYYPDDKFLIFVHTKKTGELMKKALKDVGVECEFHNANLGKDARVKLENKFKDGDLRVVTATSTLSMGINMPARRVIITGVHRGLEEVSSLDLIQMCGRAGRPAYDPVGDAYVLLPERHYDLYREKFKKPQPILSQMLEQVNHHYKTLAFHIVSEIHQGLIKTKEDVHHWYDRSLAAFQANELYDVIVDETLDLLKKYGAIWEEDGQYTVTSVGTIASLFYYSPFDVSDLKRNFTHLFDERKENSDLWLAVSLGNIDTHKNVIVSKDERFEMSAFSQEVARVYGKGTLTEPAVKMSYIYYQMLSGLDNPLFISTARGLQFDFPRLGQVLQSLDGFTGKWGKKDYFSELQMRISYGVARHLIDLCRIPEIGRARATKLFQAGIKSIADVVTNPDVVRKTLKWKPEKIEELILEAKKLFLSS